MRKIKPRNYIRPKACFDCGKLTFYVKQMNIDYLAPVWLCEECYETRKAMKALK